MPKATYFNLPEEKKQRIRDAVYELYNTRPYEQVTARELTQKAGIPVGSLYQYFESKDDVYLYHVYELQQKLSVIMDVNTPFVPRKRARPILEKLEDGRERRFVETMYDVPEPVLQKFYFEYMIKANEKVVTGFLQKQQDAGLMDKNIDLDYFSYLLTTSMFNFLVYLRKRGITDPAERTRAYRDWHYPVFTKHFLPDDD